MTYTPQDLTDLVPPIETLASAGRNAWRLCLENHNEVYSVAETPVAAWHGAPIVSPTSSELTVFRFVSRHGYDAEVSGLGIQLRVEVLARSTTAGPGGNLWLYGGTSVASAAVSDTTFAAYTLTATPAAGNEEWTLSLGPGIGKVLEVCSVVAYWVAAAPGVRAYPSGFRQSAALSYAENATINTELAGRLLNGPVFIARDRPACVFSHLHQYDISGATFSKTSGWAAWGVYANTQPVVAGRGRIPASDVRQRTYLVDYFLRSSGSITGGVIRVGATEFPVLADAWGSFEVELGPADVDVTASIDACGAGEWAYYETIQAWRMAT
jgi:hypothetical protein